MLDDWPVHSETFLPKHDILRREGSIFRRFPTEPSKKDRMEKYKEEASSPFAEYVIAAVVVDLESTVG